jgi:DNA-binding SARP family transcriptional activator/tetratricopeptide (TPR) repeat protein
MRFSVLGPVRAWRDGVELDLGAAQQRGILALLLIRAGQPVPLHEIVDVLWGPEAPETAPNIVHRYIGRLRRLLEPDLPPREPGRWLTRKSGGYQLDVPVDSVDLGLFRIERETDRIPDALDRWSGTAGAGLPPQTASHPVFTALNGEYIAALKAAADAGADERLLLRLRQAAAQHPYDEDLQAKLVRALAAGGQQAEALEVYQAVRTELADGLGLDPGPELQAAQKAVLKPSDPAPIPGPVEQVHPAQLPADIAVFNGRRSELAGLEALLPPDDGDPAAPIVTFGGMAGVGKTTLAVHFAHRVAERFGDGQLYVDLRGFHPAETAMSPGEAIRGFLDALGVPAQRIPADVDAQAALYRSLLADRRILVLLDNARDTEQVRPLLPGAAGCLTLVTSRNQLRGLVAREGARSTPLDLLTAAEAREFIVRRLGAERVARNPRAVGDLITRCGRLPLALAVVSARAALNPSFPLETIAAELDASRDSLAAFEGEDSASDARSVFSWSYRALSSSAARLFRLLSVHPGPECTLSAAAALAGQAVAEVRPILAELTQVQLISERVPGRYGIHDLLRVYAGELAEEEESSAGYARLFDYYLHSADAAERELAPGRAHIELPAQRQEVRPERFADPRTAAAWLDAERTVLLEAIALDAERGSGCYSWTLASLLEIYLDRQGRWEDQLKAQSTALAAARRAGDLAGQAHAQRALGFVNGRLERAQAADEHLSRALTQFEELSDPDNQARVYRNLAFQTNRRGSYAQSLEYYRHALARYRRTGSKVGEAGTFNEIGFTYLLSGGYNQALVECRQALALHQEIGDRNGAAATWDTLGCAHLHLGQHSDALHCFQQALRIYRAIHDRYLEADTLSHLGDAELAAGSRRRAADAWEAALEILEPVGHPDAEPVLAKLDALAKSDLRRPA